jgi:hypothetical protein
MADGMREKTTNVGGVIKRIWYAMTGATQGAQLLSLDDAGNLEGKLLNPVINGTATGTAVTTTGEASKIMKLGTNGEAKAQAFQVTALNTAPASPTATGTTGEVRVAPTGIYYCTATNTWIKALPVNVLTETITGLTSTFTNSTLPPIGSNFKFQWFISSGYHSGIIESTHNMYAGLDVLSLAIGATVQTVTADSVYSVRIGGSVLEIKFDTGSGAVSYRIASGTVTEITVNRLQYGVNW